MDGPVELVPLICIRCATPIPASVDEMAWVCAQCGQGQQLDEDKGLLPLEVHFSDGIPTNSRGKPFWVAEGRVTLQRDTYDSGRKQKQEAQQFWSQSQRFFIPAFTCTLDALLTIGTGLLRHPPQLQSGSPAQFEPVTLCVQDAHAAAEFMVVAIEAERKDKIKEIKFNLQLNEPALWILP